MQELLMLAASYLRGLFMNCRRCGKPLPNNSVACKFCGMLMGQDQLNFQRRMQENEEKRIQLLSEKYGVDTTPEYRKKKENKLLGAIFIGIILLILIIITIIVNVMN